MNTCVGAYILDNRTRKVRSFLAKKVILATGGVGQLFLRTVNSKVARGDGLAAAARAGAVIEDAEFVQFHPTSLFHRDLSNFLISEAVRGEGGQLKNRKGELFVNKYDSRGSLAPRDVVTRIIFEEMLRTGEDHVLLDVASYVPAAKIKSHFPHIYRTCRQHGIDITKEPIPVSPTAHFFCGGIKVNEWGETNIDNLYAIGEVSRTGVHGANRLASNSLLECLVWGVRSAECIASTICDAPTVDPRLILPWKYTHKIDRVDPALVQQDWLLVKSIMWNYVGIARTKKRLERAVKDLTYLQAEVEEFYRDVLVCDELVGLRHGIQAALIIAQSALKNKHSQGSHYIKADYF
jgi:L-aspartate oxidase